MAKGGQSSIQILNMNGQEVAPEISEEFKAGNHQISLNLSHLQSGIYLARYRNEEYQEVVRIMKK